MFPLSSWVAGALGLVVAVAAYTDMRERRIPNWLAGSGLVLGVGLNFYLYGIEGLKNSGFGICLALGIYFPLFALRAMGAGDVKLMGAIGAMVGPGNWLRIFILTALIGGVVALIVILHQGAVGKALKNVGRIVTSSLRGQAPYEKHPELDVTSGKGLSLPHGAVIALGAMLYIFLNMA
jgi:prepilin peptidase CpaA